MWQDIEGEFDVFIDQMANYMNPDNLTWPQLKESSPQKEWIKKANELKELLINMQMSLSEQPRRYLTTEEAPKKTTSLIDRAKQANKENPRMGSAEYKR